MVKVPGYVKRYSRILRALEVLSFYPDGLPLAQLADELGAKPAELRREILAYYTAEPAAGSGYTMPGIGFLSPTGEDDDPYTAEMVVLTDPGVLAELGAVRLTATEMAAVWRAGRILAEYEPDNRVLAEGLEVLADGWLNVSQDAEDDPGSASVAAIREAIAKRQRIRFRYARVWRPGITTRVADPYRLICTNRGWELDAGPLDEQGKPRAFLLSNLDELQILDDTFEVPDGIGKILEENRAQLRVELSLPQRAAWGVDTQADRSETILSDAETINVVVELSPPYASRLALILAPTKGEGMLMSHRDLAPQVAEVGKRLLAHHGFPLP